VSFAKRYDFHICPLDDADKHRKISQKSCVSAFTRVQK
jgi:hypothetical protein